MQGPGIVPDIRKEVADLILDAMATQGVNKSELARRLQHSKSHISQMLSGERNFTLRTLTQISHALGCRLTVSFQSTESGDGANS